MDAYKEFAGATIDEAKEKAMDYFNSNHIEFELVPPNFLAVISGKNSVRIKAKKIELSEEHDAHILKTKNFLELLVEKSMLKVKVEEKHENNIIVFELSGDDEQIFLQEQGALLDAFQHVVLKQSNGKDIGISYEIDCCEFKKERETSLKNYASKACSCVKRDGNAYIMKPLNPSERRMVHMYVQNQHGLKSESIGDGFYKKIKIEKVDVNKQGS